MRFRRRLTPKDRVSSFLARFPPDGFDRPPMRDWDDLRTRSLLGADYSDWARLVRDAPSRSLGGGLLRLLLPNGDPDLAAWNDQGGWREDWPDESLIAVAYDWLGRLYGIDPRSAQPVVSRLVPGAGEVEETDSTLEEFFFERLIDDDEEDLLSAEFYADWLHDGGQVLAPHQVAAYRIPLFLGGEDDTGNLEVGTLAVYVATMGQLASQVSGLPDGAEVASVRESKPG